MKNLWVVGCSSSSPFPDLRAPHRSLNHTGSEFISHFWPLDGLDGKYAFLQNYPFEEIL